MTNTLNELATEAELEQLWRNRFGQPLPVYGCPDLIRRVLSGEPRVISKHPPFSKAMEWGSIYARPMSSDLSPAQQRARRVARKPAES